MCNTSAANRISIIGKQIKDEFRMELIILITGLRNFWEMARGSYSDVGHKSYTTLKSNPAKRLLCVFYSVYLAVVKGISKMGLKVMFQLYSSVSLICTSVSFSL